MKNIILISFFNMYVVWLVAIISCVYSLQPGARLSLNTTIYEQIKEYLVPLIDKKLGNISLKNYSKKIPLLEVNLSQGYFKMKPIRLNQVKINFDNLSSKTSVNIYALEAETGMDIDYDFSGLKDHIQCEAFLKYMYIDSFITHEITHIGLPSVKVTAGFHMEPRRAQLIFIGGITAKLLELLEPIIRVFLVEATDIAINAELHKWIQDEINLFFSTFQVDIPINNKVFVNYEVIAAPSYYNDFLDVPLSGYAYYEGKKFPPPFKPISLPIYDDSLNFDSQFFINSYLINSAMKVSFDNNLLIYSFAYNLIYPFDMNLSCNATEYPKTFIDSDISANLSFFCNISALNRSNLQETLFNAYGILDLDVKFNTQNTYIQFILNSIQIRNIFFIKPADFNVDWLMKSAQEVVDYVLNYINKSLLQYLLPFPAMNHVTFPLPKSKVDSKSIGVFTNINIQ